MKNRRWLKNALAEAKKPENAIKPTWSRDVRPIRGLAKLRKLSAAE